VRELHLPADRATIGPDGEIMKPTKARWWNFTRAEIYLRFVEAQSEVAANGSILFDRYALAECAAYQGVDRDDLFWSWQRKIDAAKLALLLAPVSQQSQMVLKKRILGNFGSRFEDHHAAIERVMADDETYLAIPRQHRNAALSGKAVRS
jgi:hypothetical protein